MTHLIKKATLAQLYLISLKLYHECDSYMLGSLLKEPTNAIKKTSSCWEVTKPMIQSKNTFWTYEPGNFTQFHLDFSSSIISSFNGDSKYFSNPYIKTWYKWEEPKFIAKSQCCPPKKVCELNISWSIGNGWGYKLIINPIDLSLNCFNRFKLIERDYYSVHFSLIFYGANSIDVWFKQLTWHATKELSFFEIFHQYYHKTQYHEKIIFLKDIVIDAIVGYDLYSE